MFMELLDELPQPLLSSDTEFFASELFDPAMSMYLHPVMNEVVEASKKKVKTDCAAHGHVVGSQEEKGCKKNSPVKISCQQLIKAFNSAHICSGLVVFWELFARYEEKIPFFKTLVKVVRQKLRLEWLYHLPISITNLITKY